jgi:hypothetical protein
MKGWKVILESWQEALPAIVVGIIFGSGIAWGATGWPSMRLIFVLSCALVSSILMAAIIASAVLNVVGIVVGLVARRKCRAENTGASALITRCVLNGGPLWVLLVFLCYFVEWPGVPTFEGSTEAVALIVALGLGAGATVTLSLKRYARTVRNMWRQATVPGEPCRETDDWLY